MIKNSLLSEICNSALVRLENLARLGFIKDPRIGDLASSGTSSGQPPPRSGSIWRRFDGRRM